MAALVDAVVQVLEIGAGGGAELAAVLDEARLVGRDWLVGDTRVFRADAR